MMKINQLLKKTIYMLPSMMAVCMLWNELKAQSIVTYAGGTGKERFNDVQKLSDSTVLVAGEAENLAWLPAGITPTVLNIPQTRNSTNDTLLGIDSRATGKVAFILHLSPKMDKILHVVQFPANTVADVTKIKTTNAPGQPTGTIYISGNRENPITNGRNGYYIAKLNNNFVKGVPTGAAWTYDVSTRGSVTINSGVIMHKIWQPWDVNSKGNVIMATGGDFDFNFAAIEALDSNGTATQMPNWFEHAYILNGGSKYPSLTGITRGNFRSTDASKAILPDSIKILYKKDSIKLKVTGYSSNMPLKLGGTGVVSLRSYTKHQYDTLMTDENGNPGRKGLFPGDFLFANPDSSLSGGPKMDFGPGYRDYSLADWTQRVGDIAIDRRNDQIYIALSYSVNSPGSPFDSTAKAAVIAMEPNGKIRWWARLAQEVSETGAKASQSQTARRIEIDYTNNQLVVLVRAKRRNDVAPASNLWRGDQIKANPTASGFQNNFTGTVTAIEVSWLGKLRLDNSTLMHATYIAESADNAVLGAPAANPLMDGWPSPNTGNPKVDNTFVEELIVFPSGAVGVSGRSRRTMTTANAFQKMFKPDRAAPIDSASTLNSFVRVYTPNLSDVLYSSLLVGQWNPVNGNEGSNTVIKGIFPLDSSIVAVGFHLADNNKAVGAAVPAINIPTWGTKLPNNESAIFAKLDFKCLAPSMPTTISGPSEICANANAWFKAPGTNNPNWSVSGANFTGTVTADSINISTSGTGNGNVLLAATNTCAVSLPKALAIGTPGKPAITRKGNVLTSNVTENIVWLRNDSIIIGQTAATFTPTEDGSYTVKVTSANCGDFTSNAVVYTGLSDNSLTKQVKLYPNPTSGLVNIQLENQVIGQVKVTVTDLLGKPVTTHQANKQANSQTLAVDLSHLPTGIYIVEINDGKHRGVKVVNKQ